MTREEQLLGIALRYQALYLPTQEAASKAAAEQVGSFAAELALLGFGLSEEALRASAQQSPEYLALALQVLGKALSTDANWTPLVRGWQIPTGEEPWNHLQVLFASLFAGEGTKLPCGHSIPPNSFALERYTGCPFCGTPFESNTLELQGQGSELRVLELWDEEQAKKSFLALLQSPTALDASQVDSLKSFLQVFELPPDIRVGMRETAMLLVDFYKKRGQHQALAQLLKKPSDILRYLWYKHTGFLQLVQPRLILQRKLKNANISNIRIEEESELFDGMLLFDEGMDTTERKRKIKYIKEKKLALYKEQQKELLKLKYSRKEARFFAELLNALPCSKQEALEDMQPNASIWKRMIRALRLVEYAKKQGFEPLRELLQDFHGGTYSTWRGRLDFFLRQEQEQPALELITERPGFFARQLFSLILRFGSERVLTAWSKIEDRVPLRLIISLAMYAELSFNPAHKRSVKPRGGKAKTVEANARLQHYNSTERSAFVDALQEQARQALHRRFAQDTSSQESIFIEPQLYNMPLPIGDRSEHIQDLPSAAMGKRFPLKGNALRLFMQWGKGLPAQHLDMDLSVALIYDNSSDYCSYSRLHTTGAKHSGDIRKIPEQVGTAEYIELDIKALKKAGLRYALFTCNAFSSGAISPNLVFGWMDSKNPMHINEQTGVAYDPSTVQQQLRIGQSLDKGLILGVLSMETKDIVWFEMAFQGKTVQTINIDDVEALLRRLDHKMSFGALLRLRAQAQGTQIAKSEQEADRVYTAQWALKPESLQELLGL